MPSVRVLKICCCNQWMERQIRSKKRGKFARCGTSFKKTGIDIFVFEFVHWCYSNIILATFLPDCLATDFLMCYVS
jgi:hypothetical protein